MTRAASQAPVEVPHSLLVDRFAGRPIRCGVVGVGRMGQHHARVYSQLAGCELVGVVDANEERRGMIASKFNGKAFATVEELVAAGVDAVSIAVPTTHHERVAGPLLEKRIACLIEKPLAQDVETARRIKEAAEKHAAVLMVGHIERFNPAVRALQQAQRNMAASERGADLTGIAPRFIEVHRVSPMTFRSVDVSVVMDMMIHDLDVVLMLMNGAEPDEVQASGVAVLTEHEDICNARLTFNQPQGKCVANITASRLALKTERKIRIIGDNAYVSIDYARKSGLLIRKTANKLQMEEVRDALRNGTDLSDLDYGNLLALEPLEIDDADQLELEVSEFLEAVRSGRKPSIDAHAGFVNVRTAHRIMAEARKDWPVASSGA